MTLSVLQELAIKIVDIMSFYKQDFRYLDETAVLLVRKKVKKSSTNVF